MSANAAEVTTSAGSVPAVPKRITNAQTVCNQKNEKGKLCNGHLKQLRTAGELAEVHLRGDDVLSKCHLCGTLYMGPPLGHLRDPDKQSRFVENELAGLLQAAGGTLPVIKKNDKGVYVMVESAAEHGHAPATAKPAPAAKATPSAAPSAKGASGATTAAPKTPGEPNRQLNRRSTYAGIVDTGPVPGETREQKIARLTKVVAGAKQVSEAGGGTSQAPAAAAEPAAVAAVETPAAVTAASAPAPETPPAPGGAPDRTLFKRSTYAGVTDTGPIAGESHEQKIERLTKLAAAAKAKSEGG